jgi:hypothetical protein
MPTRVLSLLAVIGLLILAGCGSASSGGSGSTSSKPSAAKPGPEQNPAGDIPDNQAYVRFSPPGSTFSVKVPEGWGRTSTGGAVTFTDKLNSVSMETVAKGAAKHAGKSSTVKRTAGSAERVTYTEPSKPDPVTGKTRTNAVERYVFNHAGKDVVLTLSGPKGADNVDPWKIVTDSLRWTR